MFDDEGRRASREVRRKSPRRKKQGAAPRLHTQIPTRMGLKSMILKLEIELFLAPGRGPEPPGPPGEAAWRFPAHFGVLRGRLGAVLGRLGVVLGTFWGRFGLSWGALGAS